MLKSIDTDQGRLVAVSGNSEGTVVLILQAAHLSALKACVDVCAEGGSTNDLEPAIADLHSFFHSWDWQHDNPHDQTTQDQTRISGGSA